MTALAGTPVLVVVMAEPVPYDLVASHAISTAQFALSLCEIIDQYIKMRASTCPSLAKPRANPHLEALDQHKSPKTKANPVVPVRACHIPRIKNTYRSQKIHHQRTIKNKF